MAVSLNHTSVAACGKNAPTIFHLLEITTCPYGSGGTTASNPHLLIAPKLGPGGHERVRAYAKTLSHKKPD